TRKSTANCNAMSPWLALILALLRVAGTLGDYARQRQWLKAGEAQALAAQLRRQADDILRAEKIREDVRARHARLPHDSKLPDDGFRRD
ncbi:MAG: hypothetical protein ACRCXM_13740, partial [Beijerinckiaceae bacterium]